MKTYQDLTIRGSREALDAFITGVDRRLPDGWKRQRDREAEVAKAALGRMYCFTCIVKGTRPASELWIATQPNGNLYVSNILADVFPSLTYDQYNAILSDFYKTCIEPVAENAGVDIELSSSDLKIDDFLSNNAAKLLRSFSKLANKLNLHALDEKRWNEFLALAYREKATLDGSILKRWFIEEEGWPEDRATNLASQYEHARSLLDIYERQPA